MAFITTAQSALFSLLTASTNAAALRVTDLDLRTAPANYKAQLGSFLKALATVVTSLDAAVAAARYAYSSAFGATVLANAGTFSALTAVAPVASTVTRVSLVLSAAPSVAPSTGNTVVISVLKNGSTTVATKTYNSTVALPGANTEGTLTLSGTAADLALAAGDSLSCQIVVNGTARLACNVVLTVSTAAA